MTSSKVFLKQEARRESSALYSVWQFPSLSRALQQHPQADERLPISYPSYETKKDRKGNIIATKPVNILAGDVFDASRFEKFCLTKGYVRSRLINLAALDKLTDEAVEYVLSCGERYRNLDLDGQIWLRKIVRRSIEKHIGDNKHHGWMGCKDKDNPDEDYWASEIIGVLYAVYKALEQSGLQRIAEIVSKITKDVENKDLRMELVTAIREEIEAVLYKFFGQFVARQEEEWQEEERRAAGNSGAGEIAV